MDPCLLDMPDMWVVPRCCKMQPCLPPISCGIDWSMFQELPPLTGMLAARKACCSCSVGGACTRHNGQAPMRMPSLLPACAHFKHSAKPVLTSPLFAPFLPQSCAAVKHQTTHMAPRLTLQTTFRLHSKNVIAKPESVSCVSGTEGHQP